MGGFLNVDLEIEGPDDLGDVVVALEATRRVFALHAGPYADGHLATFELSREVATPDLAIRKLVDAVRSLPRSMRARIRRGRLDLSVGVQAGPERFELALSPAALRAAASIGARVTVCVYPEEA